MGLRRGAVEREEWPAARAIDSLYRLSLATILGCFAACLALVAGVAHREERREKSAPARRTSGLFPACWPTASCTIS
jgi:hypothetical protein